MKHKILVIILTICLIASIALSFLPTSQICGVRSGCEAVQNSPYKNTFGIDNGYLGIIAFFILLSLTISHLRTPKRYKKILIFAGVLTGSIIAFFFICLQIFVIKALCTYCLVIDIGIILGLVLIFPTKRKK
ncbi:MAG TPA: vitamin K epoxide reductase family protein [Nanoarchaeota archaeon]|nr:MAG: hypothetical protein QJ16_C0005G0053 [archaeon GW2011_AR1]HIH52392.1 vitamin K epoxide reductase family protein [Nanoarchaeota archaeon]